MTIFLSSSRRIYMAVFKYEVLYTANGQSSTTFLDGPDYWTFKKVIKQFKDNWISSGGEKEDLTSIEVVGSWTITN